MLVALLAVLLGVGLVAYIAVGHWRAAREDARNVATAPRNSDPHATFGTEANLAYLQGRKLIATGRIDDAERAIGHFKRAAEIAPNFAGAYAALADATWQVALYKQTAGTGEPNRIRTARQRELLVANVRDVQQLLERALQLDVALAEAYILRGDLKAVMTDATGAEADYRKALALSPGDGRGHEHLARFLWHLPGRDEESLAEIDRAILVDPLSPRNYYILGRMHQFKESDGAFTEAERNFQKALARGPDYHPALQWLGVIRWYEGHFAEAVLLVERALAIDPRVAWMRRPLAELYLDVGDVDTARSLLLEAPETVPPIQWLAICLYEQQPERAADLLRADPFPDGFIDEDVPKYVLRDAALASGRLGQGREEMQRPGWGGGRPFALATLAHLNLVIGDRRETERLARELLDPGFGDGIPGNRLTVPRATALTLLAQNDAALDLLEQGYASGYRRRWWYTFHRDPAFEPLRSDPRFRALATRAEAHATAERESLQQMRERGQVPERIKAMTGSTGPC